MRFFIILDNLYPQGMASSARVRSYSKGLQANGIQTTILIPEPRVRYGEPKPNTKTSGLDDYGSHYKYFGGIIRSKYFFIRQLQDFFGSISTLLYLLFILKSQDVVYLYSEKIIWERSVTIVSHIKGAKVGLEMCELPYVSENLKNTKQNRHIYFNNIVSKVDFIISISSALTDISKKYIPLSRIIKVPILVENTSIKQNYAPPVNFPYIFHSGTLHEQKDGICEILEAFAKASKKTSLDLHFISTGTINQATNPSQILKIIDSYQIQDKVNFLGYIDAQTLQQYQANCSMCIINKMDSLQNKYCFSTKLGEYLSFKRPVIITDIGEATKYLTNNINAYIVPTHDIQSMVDCILELLNEPTKAKSIGENGYKLTYTTFNPTIQMKKVIKFVENL